MASTHRQVQVEYDSVKDACDIILNTNNVLGAFNPVAQGQMQTWDGHVHTGSWRPQGVIDQKIEETAGLPSKVRNLPANFTKRDTINLLNAICHPRLGCLPPLQYRDAHSKSDADRLVWSFRPSVLLVLLSLAGKRLVAIGEWRLGRNARLDECCVVLADQMASSEVCRKSCSPS
jgi:hypothetical protein